MGWFKSVQNWVEDLAEDATDGAGDTFDPVMDGLFGGLLVAGGGWAPFFEWITDDPVTETLKDLNEDGADDDVNDWLEGAVSDVGDWFGF